MIEEVLRNARHLQEDEKFKGVFIWCLRKEDRDILKEQVKETKQKKRWEVRERRETFFYRVTGLQGRKWYIECENKNVSGKKANKQQDENSTQMLMV